MNKSRNYQIDIEEAAVYVGTYGKYNDGSLFGKWLKLSDYSDVQEFYEACHELHKDEADPEFMFQDYENIPVGLISECSISEQAFAVLESLSEMDNSEREAFLIWCNNDHIDFGKEDIDDLQSQFCDSYVGMYKDEEDFAYELIEERDDLSDFAKQYFDCEAYVKDLFSSDYWFEDGYVFHN